MIYQKYIKRLLDITISGVGIVITSPFLGVIALIIKTTSKGPVLFKQQRYGRHQKPFVCYKFRSMYITAPKDMPTWKLENPEAHITPVGKFLRKTSMDELPQLFNIFKGEMSLIGPRPVVLKEKKLIEAREKVGANDVRPGLTGWAQINGRDLVGTEEKAELDGRYVKRMSFLVDCKVFLKTIIYVLKTEDVQEGKQEDIKKDHICEYEKLNKEESTHNMPQ
ncbi:sugar transferase [Eubacterium sp. 1001713B170207_170306_E7]|uniref:sugar transferase n=1 Tax=Eubacterium sp. 1001713B170207_170306_E7 TaxID=2787097 RepID=UPI0018983A48